MGKQSTGKALGVGGVFFRSPEKEDHDFGRFGWIVDPDGKRVELWEPPKKMPEEGE
ncbi:MAG: hypothetical protein BMS9Abin30_0906 [Gammaproteobacteria bacterium]|nr:MAG: hypothetical protein BMS9Abin30_0906 [Gammaproteobacteria bacterium]